MDLQVTIVPILGSSIVVALTWIFLPALSALIADDLVSETKVVGVRRIDGDTPLLSIVIPAFDEEERLPKMREGSEPSTRFKATAEVLGWMN